MQLYLPICSTPVAYYSFFCTDIIMTNWSLIKVSFKCITLIKVSFKRTLLSSSKAAAYYFIFVLLSFISYTFSRYHYTGGHGATAPWTTSSRMSSSVPWTSSAWLAAALGEASTGSELLSFKTSQSTCFIGTYNLSYPDHYLIDNRFNDLRKLPSSTWRTLPPFLLHMQKAFWDCNSLFPFFKHSLIKEHVLWLLYIFHWNRQ